MNDFNEIIRDKVWLGSYIPAIQYPSELKKLGITHIINVCRVKCEHSDKFKYQYIPRLGDNPNENLLYYIPYVHSYIDRALNSGGKVYIHCAQGISRSPSLLISYIMKKKNLPFKESYIYVKNKRDCIHPNSGFVKQLLEYEKKLGIK